MSHTPAPWQVMFSTSVDGKVCLAIWDARTVEGQIGSPICKISPIETVNESDKANAQLIAAAPELLETLKALYEYCQFWNLALGSGIIDKTEETIKKAEYTKYI